jgi:hypothetical protein
MATLSSSTEPPSVVELLQGIGSDVRRIAVDEVDLARGKLSDYLGKLILKVAGVIVGACVAFIGLGLLCLAAVAALGPVIPALWLRLVLMSAVYLIVGGALTLVFMKRLAALHGPDLDKPIEEIHETVAAVKNGLEH